MNSYTFMQTINYPSYLQTQIQGLGLSVIIDHIDTDSSTNPMTLTLWFPSALSDADLSTLNTFMASYTDPTVSTHAINSMISAMDIDSNVILVAKTRIVNTIPSLDVLTLLQLCTLLGIDPNS